MNNSPPTLDLNQVRAARAAAAQQEAVAKANIFWGCVHSALRGSAALSRRSPEEIGKRAISIARAAMDEFSTRVKAEQQEAAANEGTVQ